ncbi:MAG: Nramp family divalent metal transporter [Aeromicrobium sp.]
MLREMPIARRVTLLGPAFIAAVAYVDPGNVATNVTAGSRFGYTLVWVVVMANLMAMLVQYLSAKLGMVTGKSLSTHLGEMLSTKPRIAFWLQAEAIAMATDIAEIVGGAIALNLLFDLPLVVGAIVTAIISMIVLRIGDIRGQSALERVIMAFLALIAVGFTAGLFINVPDGGDLSSGLVPMFAGSDSVLLASGIIGATVMPHVIYLHSSLTIDRLGPRGDHLTVRQLLSATKIDVVLALVLAGILNLSLLVVAAANLHGLPGTDTLEGVHGVVTSELGAGVALLFAVSLLGSGLASTSVGCAAGAEVMKGLLHRQVPLMVRRTVTVLPALLILSLGAEPSAVLIASQVMLSVGVPFALVPLVWLTAKHSIMGDHKSRPIVTVFASLVALIIIALNFALLGLTIAG